MDGLQLLGARELNIEPGVLLAAGIALLAFILLRRSMRYYRRSRTTLSADTIPRARNAAALIDAPNDILRWQVEMHETARDLKAEIDSKISALQTLILMAQDEQRKLESLLERSAGSSNQPADVSLERPAYAARSGPTLPGSEQQRCEIYALADEGATPYEIAEQLSVPIGEVEFLLGLRSRA